MKQLIALGTLLFTFNAAAGCPSAVPARTPEIPNGAAASEQSMFDAMAAVRSYVQTIEAYLDCRDFALSVAVTTNWSTRQAMQQVPITGSWFASSSGTRHSPRTEPAALHLFNRP